MTDPPDRSGEFAYQFDLESKPNPLIEQIGQNVATFQALCAKLPTEHRWNVLTADALRRRLGGLTDPLDLNKVYWSDLGRSIKAYNVHVLWRGAELLDAAYPLVEKNPAVLSAAILSRALIEVTTSFILNGSSLRAIVGGMPFVEKERMVLLAPELEELLAKAIFGTRLSAAKGGLAQTNIVSMIQKLAKLPGFEEMQERYERLCEVAHPNVLGNARYWAKFSSLNPDGSETRLLRRDDVTGNFALLILADTYWGLSWSAANLVLGYQHIEAVIRALDLEFPKPLDAQP